MHITTNIITPLYFWNTISGHTTNNAPDEPELKEIGDETAMQTYGRCKLVSALIIGASLSEPHTSVTALRTHVSIRPWIIDRSIIHDQTIRLSDYGPTTYGKF